MRRPSGWLVGPAGEAGSNSGKLVYAATIARSTLGCESMKAAYY